MNLKKFLVLVILFSACTEKVDISPSGLVILRAPEVTELFESGVTLNSSITNAQAIEIVEHGFLWSTSSDPDFDNSEIESFGTLNSSNFSFRIESRLEEGQRYYTRAYLKGDEITSISDTTSFVSRGSKGPVLNSFSPQRGYLSDTLILVGENFSRQDKNRVFFTNLQEGTIVSQSSDTIRVVPPATLNLDRTRIAVEVAGERTSFTEEFELVKPTIDGLSSLLIDFSDTVQIITNDQPLWPEGIQIFVQDPSFEKHQLSSESILTSPLRFVIEPSIPYREFKVIVEFNNDKATSEQTLNLVEPVISSTSINQIKYGESLRIFGKGFNPSLENNKVLFDTLRAEITEVGSLFRNGQEEDFLEVTVPFSLENAYSSRIINIGVEVNGLLVTSPEPVEIISQWFLLKNPPVSVSRFSEVTILEGAGYAMGGNDLFRYDPDDDQWTFVSTFPGQERDNASLIGNQTKLYFGFGRSGTSSRDDFYEYDINSNAWNQLSDFPGDDRSYATSFTVGSLSYLTGGVMQRRFSTSPMTDFWSFDGQTQTWARIGDHFGAGFRGSFIANVDGIFTRGALGSNSGNRTVFRFNEATKNWEDFSFFPFGSFLLDARFGFIPSESVAYLFATSPNQSVKRLFTLNTKNSEWAELAPPPMQGAYFFTIDSKMYFYGYQHPIDGKFWEYDPKR